MSELFLLDSPHASTPRARRSFQNSVILSGGERDVCLRESFCRAAAEEPTLHNDGVESGGKIPVRNRGTPALLKQLELVSLIPGEIDQILQLRSDVAGWRKRNLSPRFAQDDGVLESTPFAKSPVDRGHPNTAAAGGPR
jgi:hypothetical protein